MLCPACSVVMCSKSDTTDGIYLDLHCFNENCPTTATRYRPHVRVVLSKPPAPWRCIAYHLPIKDKDGGYGRRGDVWYILEGQEGGETVVSERDMYYETEKIFPSDIENDGTMRTQNTVVSRDNVFLVSINKFQRISAGDKMHEDAKAVLKKMNDLEIWTDYSDDYKTSGMSEYYGDWEY